MNTKEIALCGGLIALAWAVHRLMRFTEPEISSSGSRYPYTASCPS